MADDVWSKFTAQVEEYKTALKLEEAGQLAEGQRSPTDLKPGIDTSYWRMMTEMVSDLISKDIAQDKLPENLVFDENLGMALNYGLVRNYPGWAWAQSKVESQLPLPPENPNYVCVYVTQVLNQTYRDIRKVDVIKKLNREMERIAKAIEDAPAEREAAIAARDHRIVEAVDVAADAQKLKELFQTNDRELETMKMMDKKNREGGFSGKEERQRYISLTQAFQQRNEKIEYMLQRYAAVAPELHHLNTEADIILTNLLQLRDEKRQKEKEIRDEQSAVRNVSIIDIKAGLEEAVGKLKGNGRLTSKLGKAMQISVPLEERDIITPQKAYEALAEIEEMDPNLFNNRGAKRKGAPALFICPGIGEGIYDWEGHRLLIPTMYTRTVLASVASAVVLYRVDVDQSYNDRELILSYKNDIKEHKKLRSMIKLRQILIKDYLLWITKEAKGFPLMEKPNREWFEYRVGPNKYEPKFPKDMRNLTLKQQREGLEAELKKESTPLTIFRQALFYYLMEPENQEMIGKEVFPRLEKCMQQSPENLDFLYSAGAIYKKVKNKRCVELFLDYTKRAPQSWWAKKAQEHVTSFK